MFAARLFLRSVCTDVVPVVVATVLPLRSAMPLIGELALTDDAAFLDVGGHRERDVLLPRAALLVVEPHSRSTVPFCTSGMRFCEVTGWYLTSSFGIFSCFWMSRGDALAHFGVETDVFAVAQRVRQRAGGLARAEGDGAAILDLLQRAGQVLRLDGQRE